MTMCLKKREMDKINPERIPSNLSFRDNEVHIYYVQIDSVKKIIPVIKKFLTEADELKIKKFIFEKDRIVHTISAGVLENILSRYLPDRKNNINISYNEYGKPFIDNMDGETNITFNLSHSGDLILYAITDNRNVGIDVQEIREINSIDDIVESNFSEKEIAVFNSLPAELKLKAFYTCWTRKEAYIKAHGKGLSYPLNKFTVSIIPEEDAELLSDENCSVSDWFLKDIMLSEGYAAAVAVEGSDIIFRHYEWTL